MISTHGMINSKKPFAVDFGHYTSAAVFIQK